MQPFQSINKCNKRQRILRRLVEAIQKCMPSLQNYVLDSATNKIEPNQNKVTNLDKLIMDMKLVDLFDEKETKKEEVKILCQGCQLKQSKQQGSGNFDI